MDPTGFWMRKKPSTAAEKFSHMIHMLAHCGWVE